MNANLLGTHTGAQVFALGFYEQIWKNETQMSSKHQELL